jgi:hypothetical protein
MVTPDGNAKGSEENVGPMWGQPFRYRSTCICLVRSSTILTEKCKNIEVNAHSTLVQVRIN